MNGIQILVWKFILPFWDITKSSKKSEKSDSTKHPFQTIEKQFWNLFDSHSQPLDNERFEKQYGHSLLARLSKRPFLDKFWHSCQILLPQPVKHISHQQQSLKLLFMWSRDLHKSQIILSFRFQERLLIRKSFFLRIHLENEEFVYYENEMENSSLVVVFVVERMLQEKVQKECDFNFFTFSVKYLFRFVKISHMNFFEYSKSTVNDENFYSFWMMFKHTNSHEFSNIPLL